MAAVFFLICYVAGNGAAQAQQSFSWRYQAERPVGIWMFSALLFLWAIGFMAFPVSQSWSGPPEPFVRWYPFVVNGELVWRGTL